MKKIAIIYISFHHYNTKKIVEYIAKETKASIFTVEEAKKIDFSSYDIVGFASGIYMGDAHKSIYSFIDNANNLPKNIFVVITSGITGKRYVNKFSNKLFKKGFKVISSFHCKGYDTYGILKIIGGIAKGHPDKEDFNLAKNFAFKILSKIKKL